jgi:uncharacterized protein YkwD
MSSHRRTSGRAQGSRRRHRAARRPRARIALTGAAALAVVGGSTAFVCMGPGHPAFPGHRSDEAAAGHDAAQAGTYTSGTDVPSPQESATLPLPSASPTATGRTRPIPSASPMAPTTSPSPTRRAAPTATAPTHSSAPVTTAPPVTPATTAPGGSVTDPAVQQVLDLINKARAAQGLAPYTLMDGLNRSAAAHNQVMASGCGLSHQCPGEAAFGDRETAAGVHWTSAGENIGTGGPVAATSQAIAAMAVGLTQSMLDEQPPDDGHRRNILSSSFTRIGIAIYRDSSGSVWMTQDFAHPQ